VVFEIERMMGHGGRDLKVIHGYSRSRP
jgi:hypothetical protein